MPNTLSLLVPIYNEEHGIIALLENISRVSWSFPTEWIFVNDASTDNSLQELQRWLHSHREDLTSKSISTKVFSFNENRGKGAAIHEAIQHATGEVLVVQDADGEYDPSEIPELIRPILNNKTDVVYGSRFRQTSPQAHRTYHYLINRFLTLLSNLMSGLHVTDMETCYKAFRREILGNIRLRTNRFGFEPEVTAHLARTKARVWELPISYHPRSYREGKKITWKDGFAALWHLIYFNWLIREEDRFTEGLPDKYRIHRIPKKPSPASVEELGKSSVTPTLNPQEN